MTDGFFIIFLAFTIFVLCSLCGFCCRKKEEGAIFSTPVVVTSATHQAPGGAEYPIHQQTAPFQQQQPGMPMPGMPYQPIQQPYGQQPGYPGFQPYAAPAGQNAPYPPSASPYPPTTSPYPPQQNITPYPPNQSMMNPPSYTEAVGQDAYQKQAPYNPGFGN